METVSTAPMEEVLSALHWSPFWNEAFSSKQTTVLFQNWSCCAFPNRLFCAMFFMLNLGNSSEKQFQPPNSFCLYQVVPDSLSEETSSIRCSGSWSRGWEELLMCRDWTTLMPVLVQDSKQNRWSPPFLPSVLLGVTGLTLYTVSFLLLHKSHSWQGRRGWELVQLDAIKWFLLCGKVKGTLWTCCFWSCLFSVVKSCATPPRQGAGRLCSFVPLWSSNSSSLLLILWTWTAATCHLLGWINQMLCLNLLTVKVLLCPNIRCLC